MGKFFPPSVPEWHATVIGFMAGVITASDSAESAIATAVVTGVVESDGPHATQARSEAAYTLTAYVVGVLVGRRID